ncbi:MAG: hypothetical protein U1G07_20760 [Verrucomicrobiota bacterium]
MEHPRRLPQLDRPRCQFVLSFLGFCVVVGMAFRGGGGGAAAAPAGSNAEMGRGGGAGLEHHSARSTTGNNVVNQAMKTVKLPDVRPLPIQPYASLEIPANVEPSGLVKSRLWEDVYWAHNDSGDIPRIFAVHRDGRIYPCERYGAAHGVHIPDAVNVDWEDITTDDQGNLIIADFGNSAKNDRRDLCLYWIFEPHPSVGQTSVQRKVFFAYPDQKEFPASIRNFDAEAIFYAHDHVYILTKHRSDTGTTLYRLDSMEPFKVNVLTKLDSFDTQGQVTGADASPDGRRLAVLTYVGVWLFEAPAKERWFDGSIRWRPTEDVEAEAIAIDGEHLIVSAGEGDGDLYDFPISSLIQVRK